MLVDYPRTMGRKTIAAIHTRRWGAQWMMVVEFTKGRNFEETSDFIPFLLSFQPFPVVKFIAGHLGIA
jgi:hypothetical protein